MGTYVFKLPDIGEGIAEAEIVAWHVGVGETIREDQPLVDVMTDKATVELGSPVSGKVVSLKGESGRMAAVGDELVVIETGDGESETAPAKAAAPAPAKIAAAPVSEKPSAPAPVAARPAAPAIVPAAPPSGRKPTAVPAVRTRAAALGIDLATMKGTGPDGRILHEDLDAVLLRRQPQPPGPLALPREDVEEVRVTGLRRQIAETMLESKRRIPHFSYVDEVDVTALEDARRELNERFADRPKLTVLPFLICALVRTLPGHAGINAHFDDKEAVIRRYSAIHVGVATQTPRGLVVPVLRHAESRDLWEIAAEIRRLSDTARAGKATREELTGSTVTVSSLGALGGIAATPIIKPPEVAVVAVNRIVERPVVRDGAIVVRKMMNLSSSFDHRVVDGFDAASFIQDLKAYLESPALLFVE
jgi:2-oxoisovalerate dehydrogenase E2 component (dihydrolipoyl transacylase)